MFFDTHCHLNLLDCYADPAPAIEEAFAAGVTQMAAVGIDIDSSRRALELADQYPGIYGVVGVHPNYTAKYIPEDLKTLEELLKHPKAVAIGEIGLDYHWDYATKDQQFKALQDQLDLAHSTGKPIVYHCREAYKDLLPILQKRPNHPGVLHCFAGDQEDAQIGLDLGLMFGVDGPITYKKAEPLRAIFRSLPMDRILIETDAPYLTPEPHRGKPNKPAYVVLINAALAACRGIEREDCAKATTANAMRFFNIHPSPPLNHHPSS